MMMVLKEEIIMNYSDVCIHLIRRKTVRYSRVGKKMDMKRLMCHAKFLTFHSSCDELPLQR